MPEGSAVVAADVPLGWQSTISGQTVTWTGPGIPEGVQAQFEMTARLDGDVGSPLLFPAEQECESGVGYAWVDVGGSDPGPAPRLVATSAVLDPEFEVAPEPVTSAGASTRDVGLTIGAFVMFSAGAA